MSEEDIKLMTFEENQLIETDLLLDSDYNEPHIEDEEINQILEEIDTLLENIEDQISEAELWRMVAGKYSGEWLEAREQLDMAEKELSDIIEEPERMPLGSIGQALDSHEIIPLEENLSNSFGTFALIDQKLRDDALLARALNELKLRNAILIRSEEALEQTQSVSEALDELFLEEESAFDNSGSIMDTFKSYADKLLTFNTIEDIEVNPASTKITKPAL